MTGDAAVAFASGLASGDRAQPVDLWPFDATVEAACMHLLHDLEHHVLDRPERSRGPGPVTRH